MTNEKIKFKNIGKVSEMMLNHNEASFILMCKQNRITDAKRIYKEIFTPEEMIIIMKQNNISTFVSKEEEVE